MYVRVLFQKTLDNVFFTWLHNAISKRLQAFSSSIKVSFHFRMQRLVALHEVNLPEISRFRPKIDIIALKFISTLIFDKLHVFITLFCFKI